MLQKASQVQLIAMVVTAAACLVWWPAGALGVVAGGLLMGANFWFMRTMMTRAFAGPNNKAKAIYALLLGAKFFFVLAALALLVLVVQVHPIGIAAGMSTLFVGIFGGIAYQTLRTPQPSSEA
jgi:hypothetical protein